jgi:hypothetical protein
MILSDLAMIRDEPDATPSNLDIVLFGLVMIPSGLAIVLSSLAIFPVSSAMLSTGVTVTSVCPLAALTPL